MCLTADPRLFLLLIAPEAPAIQRQFRRDYPEPKTLEIIFDGTCFKGR
jgi:hypothetical protein